MRTRTTPGSERSTSGGGLVQGELTVPAEPLLSHREEIRIASKVRNSLSRLRRLLPRHPHGYRRFLSRMESATSGDCPYFPWHRLKEHLRRDLLAAGTALKRAEKLAAEDPASAAVLFDEGAGILLRYPLHPETLHQWAREACRARSPVGPLERLGRTRRVFRVLRRAVDTLERERDRLTAANLRLVLHEALRFPATGMYTSDLFQEGSLGLHKAVLRFDPERSVRFSTYATHWIRMSIRKALTDRCSLIRVPHRAQEKLRGDAHELTARDGEQIRRAISPPAFFSGFLADDTDTAFEPRDPGASGTVQTLHTETVPETVSRALLRLDTLERDIVERRFGIGRGKRETLEQIGSRVNLSRERVRQIAATALERMRRYRDLEEAYKDLSLVEASSVA